MMKPEDKDALVVQRMKKLSKGTHKISGGQQLQNMDATNQGYRDGKSVSQDKYLG